MIPRLLLTSGAAAALHLLSWLPSVAVILALLLPPAHSFLPPNQENFLAPINGASLLINQLLENTANISSLLDQNIDHIHQPVGDYPPLEERSDYLDNDYVFRQPRPVMLDSHHSINLYRSRGPPRRFRHKLTTTGIDVNLPLARRNRGRGVVPDGVTAVFPGTHWCGYGTTTMNQQMDLGVFRMTDFCCKIHDKCPYFIRPGQKKYHLINNGLYTRSHCKCDRDFFRCLKRANTLISNKIGRAYFNVLGPQCFMEAAPVTGCKRSYGNRCQSYAFDRAFPGRLVQWFDNPVF